jgi:hypothetical protein
MDRIYIKSSQTSADLAIPKSSPHTHTHTHTKRKERKKEISQYNDKNNELHD